MSNCKNIENQAKTNITASDVNNPHKKYIIYFQKVL